MYEFFRFNRFFLFAFLIFIDQVSKYIIRHTGGFYICNKGVAFGIIISWKVAVLLSALFLFFTACLIFLNNFQFSIFNFQTIFNNQILKFKKASFIVILSITLVFSGAVSNLIDRARYGCVVDFIDLHFFPVFNFADVFISIGAVGIAYVLYKKNKADLAL